MRIIAAESLTLIIDVQERLFPVMHEKEAFLKKLTTLIKGLNLLGIDCMLSEQYKKGLGQTIKPVMEAFEKNEPLRGMRPEKKHFSVLDHEPAVVEIQRRAPRFLLIAGIETHVCVLQTALDAKEEGFIPVVVADACSSRFALDKSTALQRMQMEGIRITTVESLLFELCRVSGTDTFKQISKLVK